MGYQNSALFSRDYENLGIGNPCQSAVSGRGEIDGLFSLTNRFDDNVAQVGVGLEADQARDPPIFALAH